MPHVKISCPDKQVEAYCNEAYVDKWNEYLPRYLQMWEPDKLQEEFTRILAREARLQEWFCYEDVDGRRQMVLDDSDEPVPLVPQVVIE